MLRIRLRIAGRALRGVGHRASPLPGRFLAGPELHQPPHRVEGDRLLRIAADQLDVGRFDEFELRPLAILGRESPQQLGPLLRIHSLDEAADLTEHLSRDARVVERLPGKGRDVALPLRQFLSPFEIGLIERIRFAPRGRSRSERQAREEVTRDGRIRRRAAVDADPAKRQPLRFQAAIRGGAARAQ